MKRSFLPKTALLIVFLAGSIAQVAAFCGFYVAKADAKLFNKSSQVIIARADGQTVITMSNDFSGEVKDFAMVVPVPEVLKKEQIRIAEQSIFDKLDTYSGPRLVEYFDEDPCNRYPRYYKDLEMATAEVEDFADAGLEEEKEQDYKVTIEESYTVGEYDILVLSAQESDGLKRWLIDNDYKIPADAEEVLDPYIKNQLKFFVVKVNLDEFKLTGAENLRPLQMSFRSDKFGLPIRLGMANANGDQDLIVYAFSEKGRVEVSNYRTTLIPTNKNIPSTVKEKFGDFYLSVFEKAWEKAGKNIAIVEYAWDLSSRNFVKCDPCPTQPPMYTELREAGVFWVDNYGGSSYQGELFMTRLHLRYNRETFPQDLTFIQTPNKQQFQGRYIMTHPPSSEFKCDQAQQYLKTLKDRRKREVRELAALTGWDTQTSEYRSYINQYDTFMKSNGYLDRLPPKDKDKGGIFALPVPSDNTPINPWPFALFGLALMVMLVVFFRPYLTLRFES